MRKKEGLQVPSAFFPGYPATLETVLKPEGGSLAYTYLFMVIKCTKFSTNLPPYVGFVFSIPSGVNKGNCCFPVVVHTYS